MTVHRSSRFTVLGDLFLALVILAVGSALAPNQFGGLGRNFWMFTVCLIASTFIYWFLFRVYYDTRYFKGERLVMMPPNLGDSVLLHELLHIQIGDIEGMTRRARFVAITPLGPFVFWPQAYRKDYGESGVTKEMTKRGQTNPRSWHLPIGCIPFYAFAIIGGLVIPTLLAL